MTLTDHDVTTEGVQRVRKDVRAAAATLGDQQARYLVDAYYSVQKHRMEAANYVRGLKEAEEPSEFSEWLAVQQRIVEDEIQKILGVYSLGHEAGVWARSIVGIGPVIAAGLLAHIDINRAPSAGNVWSFAGLNPSVTWGKGEKRPWNAKLKTLCWKIGESFTKQSGRPCYPAGHGPDADIPDIWTPDGSRTEAAHEHAKTGCMNYGHVYILRKELETARNEAGMFSEQAEESLASKNYGKTTDAYKAYEQGKLPPARIHLRSQRYAVKLFLAHFHHVLFESTFGKPVARPWVIEHGGHVDYVPPPNWPVK